MLKAIQQFFSQSLQADTGSSDNNPSRLHLAAAALLIEVAEIDSCSVAEEQQLASRLQQLFALPPARINELIQLARQEAAAATDWYQFTRLINDHYSRDEKYQLIVALWHVALADDSLNHYEEYTIRRIADLLHVDHSDFIRAKLTARDTKKPA
ncbi:MAG TPA: TerB family tellurite resistance protein [Pseudomonadales bacterium]